MSIRRFVLPLVVIGVGCFVARAEEREPRHDGNLWLQMDWNERMAFTNGHGDCDVDVLGNPFWPEVENLEREIFEYYYYRPNESRLQRPIRLVMKEKLARHSNDPPSKKPATKEEDDGEIWPEKHGFLDGDYWGAEDNRATQIAFVRGQIECYQLEPKSKFHFSKAPAEYVRLISEWYDAEGPDSKRRLAKIPDVLLRFMDRPLQRQSKPGQQRQQH